MSDKLPSELKSLLTPTAYGHPVRDVKLVETHVSWVFLTGELAYKIKRPVAYPFVDLRSAEQRAYFCGEEIRLNRRFAPDLYLDVCAVTRSGDRIELGGDGEVIEHAVRMREFPSEGELDRLLESGNIEPGELARFGRELSRIHGTLPKPEPGQTLGEAAATSRIVLENLAECVAAARSLGTASALGALEEPLAERLRALEPLLAERFAAGRVRECHGDLHAGNVARFEGRLVAFDCIEFEPAFRWIDVADEISFLLVDLARLGCPRHARAFLDAYLRESGDYQACRLLPLYKAHRALVRAKIAALREGGAGAREEREAARAEHRAWLSAAEDALRVGRPRLVAATGLSGSGKTWLGKRIAAELDAVVVRSDVERKRLWGVAELEGTGSALGEGAYSREAGARVYERLVAAAEDALRGGVSVVVDATFQRKAERARLRELAERTGVTLELVVCHAPSEVLLSRIAARRAEGADASEADQAVLAWQERRAEPIDAEEQLFVVDADTTDGAVVSEVLARLSERSSR